MFLGGVDDLGWVVFLTIICLFLFFPILLVSHPNRTDYNQKTWMVHPLTSSTPALPALLSHLLPPSVFQELMRQWI